MNANNSSRKLSLITVLALLAICSFAQTSVTDPLTLLKEGNLRFRTDQSQLKNEDMLRVNELSSGQNPFAVIVSCSDSRVAPEIIFDQGLGDLFVIRTAGNVMSDMEEGSIEYAASHLGSKLIVVLGHTKCGAVKAFVDMKKEDQDEHHGDDDEHGELGHIESIMNKFDSQDEMEEALNKGCNTYHHATIANVIHGVKQLRNSDPILSKLNNKGQIQILGAVYNIETGAVEFLDI